MGHLAFRHLIKRKVAPGYGIESSWLLKECLLGFLRSRTERGICVAFKAAHSDASSLLYRCVVDDRSSIKFFALGPTTLISAFYTDIINRSRLIHQMEESRSRNTTWFNEGKVPIDHVGSRHSAGGHHVSSDGLFLTSYSTSAINNSFLLDPHVLREISYEPIGGPELSYDDPFTNCYQGPRSAPALDHYGAESFQSRVYRLNLGSYYHQPDVRISQPDPEYSCSTVHTKHNALPGSPPNSRRSLVPKSRN
jgi:hypothetical protein